MRSLTFRAKNGALKLGETTALMGVVNVTPDSFYPGSRRLDPDEALAFALKQVEAGADIVDIGGESTRPGASPVDAVEENPAGGAGGGPPSPSLPRPHFRRHP